MAEMDIVDRNRALADAFVKKLCDMNPQKHSQIDVPDLSTDPGLLAKLRVADALATAGRGEKGPTSRMRSFALEADGLISEFGLPPDLEDLARNAVRAILVHNMPGQQQNLDLLYRPFEPYIPFSSLAATQDRRPPNKRIETKVPG